MKVDLCPCSGLCREGPGLPNAVLPNTVPGAPNTAHLACLLNQIHPIHVIRSLIETPRPETCKTKETCKLCSVGGSRNRDGNHWFNRLAMYAPMASWAVRQLTTPLHFGHPEFDSWLKLRMSEDN